ncbi:putative ABC transporter permease protein [Gordonia hirsuta DSM 44140 = NBRC 16056]|uniref:Putative ABC transporter permease protein n=1 Tax=Gordonia hirsuta DSM 44140 = NBRC 16056 TaxID=1121927 RepID=L7LD10_9ACTN|nr:iron chelate uptake ABC transporter family permease subunit [Gordonia hirsuta]GAC58631.1 putative ABC transporter permease protein [Gordonia hirsuta DSM 44140 = NBRC 16056]
MTDIDFGRRVAVVRTADGRVSLRADLRAMLVVAVVVVATGGVFAATLMLGDLYIPAGRVLSAIFTEPATRAERGIARVVQDRLARALLAVLLGIALGISGAVIQSLTRNPLGSPDVIGFNTGAYTGALLVIVFGGAGGYLSASAAALAGGIGTALVVYLLAFRQGVQGFRLIVVGIGVSAMLASVNTWLILTADLDTAMSAAAWGAGSLSLATMDTVAVVAVVLAVVLILLVPFAPGMKVLEMGDDAAAALGVRTERTRLGLLVLGVALTALATAAAGPIAFVALAAPQLAKRMTRSAGVTLVAAAAVGALLLSVSDLIAKRLFAPLQLPVGVVTVSIGGIYLIWLIAQETRRN